MADDDSTLLPDSYHRARRQYGLFATILLVWEFLDLGIENVDAGSIGIQLTVGSADATPFVLFALVFYYAFRISVEWKLSPEVATSRSYAIADFTVAHVIGTIAAVLFGVQLWLGEQVLSRLVPLHALAVTGGLSFSTTAFLMVGLPAIQHGDSGAVQPAKKSFWFYGSVSGCALLAILPIWFVPSMGVQLDIAFWSAFVFGSLIGGVAFGVARFLLFRRVRIFEQEQKTLALIALQRWMYGWTSKRWQEMWRDKSLGVVTREEFLAKFRAKFRAQLREELRKRVQHDLQSTEDGPLLSWSEVTLLFERSWWPRVERDLEWGLTTWAERQDWGSSTRPRCP